MLIQVILMSFSGLMISLSLFLSKEGEFQRKYGPVKLFPFPKGK